MQTQTDATAIRAFVDWLLTDDALLDATVTHAQTIDDPLGIAVVDATARRSKRIILEGTSPAAFASFRTEVVETLTTGEWAFINCFLMAVGPQTRRGKRDEVRQRLAVCLDVDVRPATGMNVHAKGSYLPTMEQAEVYVAHLRDELNLRPWVNATGGGFHVWVAGPACLGTQTAAALAEVLAADLAAWGIEHGWQADISPTLNPTLMLRPTGTVRVKADGAFLVKRVDRDAERSLDRLARLWVLATTGDGAERRAVIDRMSRWVAAVAAEAKAAEGEGRTPAYVPVPDPVPARVRRERTAATARVAAGSVDRTEGSFEVTPGMQKARLLDPARILVDVLGWTQDGDSVARPGSNSGRSGVVFTGDDGYDLVYLWSDGSRAQFGCPVQDAASLIRHLCGGSMRHAEGFYRMLDYRGGEMRNEDEAMDFLVEFGAHPAQLTAALEETGLVRKPGLA